MNNAKDINRRLGASLSGQRTALRRRLGGRIVGVAVVAGLVGALAVLLLM